MVLGILKSAEIIETMENYISRVRPPEEIRDQLDIGYEIDNQSIILTEIRPRWDNPSEVYARGFAKATYIKKQGLWRIFWLRADLKWHTYRPNPVVKQLQDFLDIVDEDEYACFKG